MANYEISRAKLEIQQPDGTWTEIKIGNIESLSQPDNPTEGENQPLALPPVSFTVNYKFPYNIYWSLVRGCKMTSEFFSGN